LIEEFLKNPNAAVSPAGQFSQEETKRNAKHWNETGNLPTPATPVGATAGSALPESPEELYLAGLWEKLLNVSSIKKQDSFFELGGHSLTAVRMFSEIQTTSGLNLPLATLFTAPTIEKLALLIKEKRASSNAGPSGKTSMKALNSADPWRHLVPIKPEGSLPPFFCVHGVAGNVLNYYQFVPHLAKEQPLYGLQCRGLDGIARPFGNVRAMARAYVAEIRQIQPRGPYLLGGGSFGGTVAFEMAQQLISAQEAVGILVMFDSICSRLVSRGRADSTLKNEHLFARMRHGIWCRCRDSIKMAECSGYRIMGRSIPHELRYWHIERKNTALDNAYLPMPYRGTITMFRATLGPGCADPYRGWKGVAQGGMRFFDFPCEHALMIEHPAVGKKLSEILLSIALRNPR
jgi:aspartate racemase